MLTTLLETCSSPVGVLILAALGSCLGVWGSRRALTRRLGHLEDDIQSLTERFERSQKKLAGRASVEVRASHMQEAAEIAARAQAPQTIKLPGRISA